MVHRFAIESRKGLPQEEAGEVMTHCVDDSVVSVEMHSSNERGAPISVLSAKSRFALIECWDNKTLQKYKRVWRGSPDGLPINGNTVASLGRDGLLTVTKSTRAGTARLTERGNWFVRTLLAVKEERLSD